MGKLKNQTEQYKKQKDANSKDYKLLQATINQLEESKKSLEDQVAEKESAASITKAQCKESKEKITQLNDQVYRLSRDREKNVQNIDKLNKKVMELERVISNFAKIQEHLANNKMDVMGIVEVFRFLESRREDVTIKATLSPRKQHVHIMIMEDSQILLNETLPVESKMQDDEGPIINYQIEDEDEEDLTAQYRGPAVSSPASSRASDKHTLCINTKDEAVDISIAYSVEDFHLEKQQEVVGAYFSQKHSSPRQSYEHMFNIEYQSESYGNHVNTQTEYIQQVDASTEIKGIMQPLNQPQGCCTVF